MSCLKCFSDSNKDSGPVLWGGLWYAFATALKLSRLSLYLVDLNENEWNCSQIHKHTSRSEP